MNNGQKFSYALRKLDRYLLRALKGNPSNTTMRRVYKWTCNIAHEIFEIHPELREENSGSGSVSFSTGGRSTGKAVSYDSAIR